MKTHRTFAKLAVAVATLLLLGATVAAVMQRTPTNVTRVPVCIKNNGQLRVLVDAQTVCGPSERQMEWVIDGEVTNIQLGHGLVGRREDGTVHLALDPSIIQGCSSCAGGRVFAGFDDGPRDLQNLVLGEDLPQIAKLDPPAGSYAIFAKLAGTNVGRQYSSAGDQASRQPGIHAPVDSADGRHRFSRGPSADDIVTNH